MLAISRGQLPKRPPSTSVVTDDQWEFILQCWSPVATDRPSDVYMVKFVHDQLLSAVAASDGSTVRTQSRGDTLRDSEEWSISRVQRADNNLFGIGQS